MPVLTCLPPRHHSDQQTNDLLGFGTDFIIKLGPDNAPVQRARNNVRVSDQNGVSQAWYIVEIHHSGRKPSNCSLWFNVLKHLVEDLKTPRDILETPEPNEQQEKLDRKKKEGRNELTVKRNPKQIINTQTVPAVLPISASRAMLKSHTTKSNDLTLFNTRIIICNAQSHTPNLQT